MKIKKEFKPTRPQIIAYWELNNPEVRIDGLTVLEAYYKNPRLRVNARKAMARDLEKIKLYFKKKKEKEVYENMVRVSRQRSN